MFSHVQDNVVRYAKSLRKSGTTIWRGGVAGKPADFALYTSCVVCNPRRGANGMRIDGTADLGLVVHC